MFMYLQPMFFSFLNIITFSISERYEAIDLRHIHAGTPLPYTSKRYNDVNDVDETIVRDVFA